LSFSVLYPAQAFLEARFYPATEKILRGATTMHEIPNFPPSQNEPEQSTLAQLELGQAVVINASTTQAEESQQASSED
jgi:hypothetical protein